MLYEVAEVEVLQEVLPKVLLEVLYEVAEADCLLKVIEMEVP